MADKKFTKTSKNWIQQLLTNFTTLGTLAEIINGYSDGIQWNDFLAPMFRSETYNGTDALNSSDIYSYIEDGLKNDSNALDYWNSLSDFEKERKLSERLKDADEGWGTLGGLIGSTQEYDVDALIDDLIEASEDFSYDGLEKPTFTTKWDDVEKEVSDKILTGKDPVVEAYLNDLQETENAQTQLYKDQLSENKLAFDQYRQQILSNQYQQNAQLMGSVDSAMDKARRNALEAGASAGLRMAENINTTLALQNKQAQISLETSNQLAQQLLNQRQANAGIRSEYNQMLADNAAERRSYKDSAIRQGTQDRYNRDYTDYQMNTQNYQEAKNERLDRLANSTNPFANSYATWYDKKQKSQSQYN